MKKQFCGKAVLVGDNIDTDIIYPGRYLELTETSLIASHCLEGIADGFAADFPENGVLVAGRNFGCGSSREHAAIAISSMGASLVLAESFARIFFRNGINLGLPLIKCSGISSAVKSGQTLRVDLNTSTVTIEETGEVLNLEPVGEKTMEILSAGGIKSLMRKKHSVE